MACFFLSFFSALLFTRSLTFIRKPRTIRFVASPAHSSSGTAIRIASVLCCCYCNDRASKNVEYILETTSQYILWNIIYERNQHKRKKDLCLSNGTTDGALYCRKEWSSIRTFIHFYNKTWIDLIWGTLVFFCSFFGPRFDSQTAVKLEMGRTNRRVSDLNSTLFVLKWRLLLGRVSLSSYLHLI